MNVNLQNIIKYSDIIQQRAQKAWRRFLFTPTRYWKNTLLVFAAILLIILLADAWVFWQLARALQFEPDEIGTTRYVLKRAELEQALSFLGERSVKFLETIQTPPPREIFAVPPTSSAE